ncbi:SDR family NAD(P)-dependent oxidoreductase [Pseudoroseicyclus tamaricis]|uniref:SDR family oxidoreductase n=1 Tax=Pseudoroseicyclus tamaricis TaxID=2705421 RepID=A0A6B2JMA0_9RHOB|nr:SDR family oxidoreductase [Pseudoroseicyclus tamaricis]NDU99766.1 SDR family oxidoreductase [Pseudoroseicyclus tamaricis]
MSFSIDGKTAIVTGGAHGVGLAIGLHFLEQGANVVFVDRDEEALNEELGDRAGEGSSARIFAGDLREKLTIANLLSLTIDAFDDVDILVNASRQIIKTELFDPEDDSVPVMMEQNMLASLQLSRIVAKKMIKLTPEEEVPRGAIVNISTIAARMAHPELLAYSVSNAALEQLTRSMAVALAPERIRVNAVSFGSVMSHSLHEKIKDDDEMRERVVGRTPLGRIASPRELAEAVQFLASDGAGFITGQVLTVDGGRSLLDPAACSAF